MKKKWVLSAEPGDVIHVNGFPWRLEAIGPHAVKLVDEETGEVWAVEQNQLLAMDIDLSPDAEEDDTSARMEAFQALDADSKYQLEEIASHLNEIMTSKRYWPGESPDSVEVNPKYGPGVTRTQRIERKVDELKNTHLNYKERTWWKFLGVYELDDASTLASFKSPGRPSQVDPKYAEALQAALDHYLSNGPMPDLRDVLDLAVQYVEESPDYKGAKVPSLATQYRLLRDRRRRLGIFGSNWKYAQSRAARPKASHMRPQAHMPGERLQMDTTRANVLVRDYFGNEYRPEITLVKDPVTRMIHALIVSRSTGEKEIAALMLQLFTPKPDAPPLSPEAHYNLLGRNARHLLKYLEDEGELGPATGMIVVPRVVVIDRGRAYDNAWLRKLAAVMGFSIELSRPRTPTDKPHVERAFRTLNPILAKLPGYVGRNTVERGRGKAYRHEALLTMAELETLLKAWVHHVYHHRPHKGLVLVEGRQRAYLSPYQASEALLEQYGHRLQMVRPDLSYWLMASVTRVVDDGGISINGLRYESRLLDPIRKTHSPATKSSKWQVHYDWNDLRFCYVNRSQGLRAQPDWVAVPWVDAPKELAVPFPEALRLFLRRHEARLDAAGTPIAWQVPRELRGRVEFSHSEAIGARMKQFVRFLVDLEQHRQARDFKDTETAAVVLELIEAARATVRWYPAQEAWNAADPSAEPLTSLEAPAAPEPVSVRRRPIRSSSGLPRKLI